MLTRVNMRFSMDSMIIDDKEVFTVKELSKIKKCSRQAIHQLAVRKGIKFKKLGPINFCSHGEAQALIGIKRVYLNRSG